MVWVVVWLHVHTVELANGNEIYKYRKKKKKRKKKRVVDPSIKALRDYWGVLPHPKSQEKNTTKIQHIKVLAKVIQVVTKPTTKTTATQRVHNPCALANAAQGCHAC